MFIFIDSSSSKELLRIISFHVYALRKYSSKILNVCLTWDTFSTRLLPSVPNCSIKSGVKISISSAWVNPDTFPKATKLSVLLSNTIWGLHEIWKGTTDFDSAIV